MNATVASRLSGSDEPGQSSPEPVSGVVGPRWSRWDALAVAALTALVVLLYLPFALDGGWYLDDWSIYAPMDDAAGSLGARYDVCRADMPAGRSLACVYHASVFTVLGDHRTLYHLVAMAFLLLIAVLGYRVLRWCRLSPVWAVLVPALLITFPASDATRLWPVGAVAQYVIALQLGALLIALNALRLNPGPRRIALHVLAGAISVFAMVTYEIAVPLVAFNVVVYLAAYRSRRVLWRGLVDLGLVLAFLVYRVVISPPPEGSAQIVDRDLPAYVDRAGALLRGAWGSWTFSFARSATLAVICLVVLLVVALAATARDPRLPRRLLPWLGMLVASAVLSIGAILVYLTANDFYIPDVTSTFNRLNAPAALAYCAAFVALLGLLYEVLRSLAPARLTRFAPVVVGLVALAVAWHQAGVLRNHQQTWEQSWELQSDALDGYRVALRGVPELASIVGFDTPAWKPGYVPVFATTWDLRGALDYETGVDPPVATPAATGVTCGATGVQLGEQVVSEYRGEFPLYFVSPTRRKAVRVTSRARCQERLDSWGVPAAFG